MACISYFGFYFLVKEILDTIKLKNSISIQNRVNNEINTVTKNVIKSKTNNLGELLDQLYHHCVLKQNYIILIYELFIQKQQNTPLFKIVLNEQKLYDEIENKKKEQLRELLISINDEDKFNNDDISNNDKTESEDSISTNLNHVLFKVTSIFLKFQQYLSLTEMCKNRNVSKDFAILTRKNIYAGEVDLKIIEKVFGEMNLTNFINKLTLNNNIYSIKYWNYNRLDFLKIFECKKISFVISGTRNNYKRITWNDRKLNTLINYESNYYLCDILSSDTKHIVNINCSYIELKIYKLRSNFEISIFNSTNIKIEFVKNIETFLFNISNLNYINTIKNGNIQSIRTLKLINKYQDCDTLNILE